jgi:AcrR family transcriptional regulator
VPDDGSGIEGRRPRIVKAAPVRRAELIDVAQRLFLQKGYERTTINDVIEATGLSKGAFYHHFRAKEDLLEAIVQRFTRQALAGVEALDPSLDALSRLNTLLAMSREWKAEHVDELKALLNNLLAPENVLLFHRIANAGFAVITPRLAEIIEDGNRQGVFDAPDPPTTAEVLMHLAEGRRAPVILAMNLAESGRLDEATVLIMRRVRAEEAVMDRLLGVAPGSVRLVASEQEIVEVIRAWIA